MNRTAPEARAATQPAGVIDSLQAGFNTLNRNVWLLILPIAVDLIIWLGPQISVGMLADRLLANATPPPGVDTAVTRSIDELRRSALQDLSQDGGLTQYDLLKLLAVPVTGLGLPSFAAARPSEGTPIAVDSIEAATAVALASILVGLCVAALFYGLLAQAVREGRAIPHRFMLDFAAIWIWLIALMALILGVGLGVLLPLVLVVAAVVGVAPGIGGVFASVGLAIAIWAVVYLFFTTSALFVSRVPPLTAVQRSMDVVRHNFWSALFFTAAFALISTGLPMVWHVLANALRTPGTILGIVGNDYILAGLAAGSMEFYKERAAALRAAQSNHR